MRVRILLAFWAAACAVPLAAAGQVQPPAATERAFDDAVRVLREFRAAPLQAALADLTGTFGEAYPRGDAYRKRLSELDQRRRELLTRLDCGDLDGCHEAVATARELEDLRCEALLSNPLLSFDRLLLVRRAYRLPPGKLPNGKPRTLRPKPWSYNEALEGDALGLPVNHNSIFSLRRAGYENDVAVLSPVRPAGKLTTLYRPAGGLFVGEVDLDFDAQRMLLTMPEDDRWQVFELGADGNGLVRVTPNDEPDVDNYDACYLPDGRIVFCSTANYQSVPCWNGLHNVGSIYLLERQSGRVRQLTFDQDDDNYPSVLNTGQILFTRWEYANIPHFFGRLLFSMNPDGTDQREFYGSNSYWPNAMYYARAVPGHPSKVVAIVSGHHGDYRMGNLAVFDPAEGRQQHQGLVFKMPDTWSDHLDLQMRYPAGVEHPPGYADQREPIVRDRLTSHDWPKFLHPFPLSEKYILVSAKPAPQDNWGIYLADTFGNLTLVFEQDGYSLLEPVPLQPMPRPPIIADRVDTTRRDGVVYLQDVYRGPGLAGVPRGQVKSLRVFAYSFGYRGVSGYDKIAIDGAWDVMRILGTVPVEQDGSASFRVPANTPLSVQPLDEQGRALQLMRSWFTVMPGETRSCVGCHESQNTGPMLRQVSAVLQPPAEIAPWYGPPRGFSFEREVQPVLDRYCVECHDGKQTTVAGRPKPDLRPLDERPDYQGILTNVPEWYEPGNLPPAWDAELQRIGRRKHIPIRFTPAYEALIKYVRRTGPEGDYHLLEPGEYRADTSLLVQILEQGHHGVQLDREAWDRLVTWIDLNVPCHGTWSEALEIPFDGVRRKHELLARYAGLDVNTEDVVSDSTEPLPPVPAREPEIAPGDAQAVAWPFDGYEARLRQEALDAPRERLIDLGAGQTMKLVLVPPGEFIMGDDSGSPSERPQTRVRIAKPFWIGATEVTNAQFHRFDPSHDSRFEREQKMNVHSRGYPLNLPGQPVVRVTWQQSIAFCKWLSEATGEPFTLPTEAQWEYACRAGSAWPMSWGGSNENFAERANMADRSIKLFSKWDVNALNQTYDGWMPLVEWVDDGAMVTTEPGRYASNAWGLSDMHGNAAEWTSSLYRQYPYRAGDGREDLSADGPRVVRGGSWCDLPQFCTAAWRFGYPPWRKVHNVGFRVVVPIGDPPSPALSTAAQVGASQ